MLSSTAIRREYSGHSDSNPKEADSCSVRGNQTNSVVHWQTKTKDSASDNELSDSQAEEEKETGDNEKTDEDELIQEDQDWPDQTVVVSDYPTTTFECLQRPEFSLTTTISDDRSHDSKFQRDAAGHLLNALVRQRSRQPQELQSGRSGNHGAVGTKDHTEQQTGPRKQEHFAQFQNQSPAVQQKTRQIHAANLQAQQVSVFCGPCPAAHVLAH